MPPMTPARSAYVRLVRRWLAAKMDLDRAANAIQEAMAQQRAAAQHVADLSAELNTGLSSDRAVLLEDIRMVVVITHSSTEVQAIVEAFPLETVLKG